MMIYNITKNAVTILLSVKKLVKIKTTLHQTFSSTRQITRKYINLTVKQ